MLANPLRELLATPPFALKDGAVTLDESPGLGVEPYLQATRGYLVAVADV